mgnify:CR=1 FL=1
MNLHTNLQDSLHDTLHDRKMCSALLDKLKRSIDEYGKPIRFMEVCGTHTVSIFQSGLRTLLPEGFTHLSGPGCPVCVTHDSEVATFLRLAEKENVILATFGDLIRVPAPDGRSLKHSMANGANVQIVYSPMDAVKLALDNPQKEVVFLGVGFETTAPTIAATIMAAKSKNIKNYSVFCCHKLVPPALAVLLDNNINDRYIDAFLLPGHVSLVTGLVPFEFIAKDYRYPAVVAGFEPAEIIHALYLISEQKRQGKALVENAYTRAVSYEGNVTAKNILNTVFEVCDTKWRGLGEIPQSGLKIKKDFADFDALIKHDEQVVPTKPLAGCKCGEVLQGKITPAQCPLFAKVCTPQNPTGPCMVSTEGSCAAWYNYQGLE